MDEEKSREDTIIFLDIRKLHKIQISVSISEVVLEHSHATRVYSVCGCFPAAARGQDRDREACEAGTALPLALLGEPLCWRSVCFSALPATESSKFQALACQSMETWG